jgi:hypothetical protein
MGTRAGRRRLGGAARAHRAPARRALAARCAAAVCAATAALAAGGCGTSHPPPIGAGALAEAQTFPYYRVYWVGPTFIGRPLAAVDGQKGYLAAVGTSVYYGDCVHQKGIFGGGSCVLPLQVTTVIYHLHRNATLGPQRNIVVRGVPATVYDEGRSIEVYSGRVAIDIFSDSFEHAYRAALQVRPLNAPGSPAGRLPPPVYCPELSGAMDAHLQKVMEHLPGHACQKASAAVAFAKSLTSPASGP